MTKTAVVLVGGRGTRLGSLTDSIPKPLLSVAGRPFILHVLDHLAASGISVVILAAGYLSDKFRPLVDMGYRGMSIGLSVEDKPLGTGGAIRRALEMTQADRAFALNGDTFFQADYRILEGIHSASHASLTLLTRHVPNVARFGHVITDGHRVVAIREKLDNGPGFVNGGIYLIERMPFLSDTASTAFSVEHELLPRWVSRQTVFAASSDGYFVDIGIPSDLRVAERALAGGRDHLGQ